jgi:hypothetical protein
MPCPCHSMLLLPSAAICCHPCHPMLCPQISAPKFRKPTRWWEYSGGGTIEGIMWEHNVDTLWGYNGEAQCGGTMWAQCRGTMWQQQWQHNVGAQSICGGTINLWGHGMPCPHNHATIPPPCHYAPTMLPCHDLTPMPCPYHAINPPHALPLPCHPLPSHAPTVLPLRSYSQR